MMALLLRRLLLMLLLLLMMMMRMRMRLLLLLLLLLLMLLLRVACSGCTSAFSAVMLCPRDDTEGALEAAEAVRVGGSGYMCPCRWCGFG
jgi:hypothetical protein